MTFGKHISFLGAGNMAEAIFSGLLDAGTVNADEITAADPKGARLEALHARYGIRTRSDNRQAAAEADIIMLAVKPQQVPAVLQELKASADSAPLWVSIAAGVPTQLFLDALGPSTRVIRVMPNTPSLVRHGVSAISRGGAATDEDEAAVTAMFSAIGVTAVVPETQLAAVTALSGSGPAYFFRFVEAMIEAAQAAGLPESVASQFAAHTALGAAQMMVKSEEGPGTLRERVTSKGGTTAAALARFDNPESSLHQLVAEAMGAAKARAESLEAESLEAERG